MIKRTLLAICLILFLATYSFAAGTVTFLSVEKYPENNPTQYIISYTCTSDASAGTLPAKDILVSDVGFNYWKQGLYVANMKAVNGAANYPTAAQALSLVDSDGTHLVSSTIGDSLTLSTSASAVAVMTADRAGSQRDVNKLLTIGAVGSSIGNSKVYILRITLRK